ncbi:LarC family nickel insertion protein [Priestia megaterium]|uniref:LarC family nickel insertion protein n=1 Tax=Priestia megaterium TaxID=1404 RepID=UPI002785E6C8|nr:uncharacterized protein (TIGR00299 family) protein [Bacillus sp. 1751]
MKTLYFDCFSGISGDMVIGALIDAGADPIILETELKKLNIDEEYQLKWNKIVKNGISSTKFDVLLTKDGRNHHHVHDHHHRSYKDIVELIESANFAEQVKSISLRIFKKIGQAEGHIHGLPLEEVHFHEVGAVDSIIDIVGAAILIHQLGIETVKSSPIPVGTGEIHIDHGIYPIPAPATLEILKEVPIEQSDIKAELTTPTGAAIVSVLAEEYCTIPSMKVKQVGHGAGTRTFEKHPNVIRVIIGEEL